MFDYWAIFEFIYVIFTYVYIIQERNINIGRNRYRCDDHHSQVLNQWRTLQEPTFGSLTYPAGLFMTALIKIYLHCGKGRPYSRESLGPLEACFGQVFLENESCCQSLQISIQKRPEYFFMSLFSSCSLGHYTNFKYFYQLYPNLQLTLMFWVFSKYTGFLAIVCSTV